MYTTHSKKRAKLKGCQDPLNKFEKKRGRLGRQIKTKNGIYTCHGTIQQKDPQIMIHLNARFFQLFIREINN
jgi:hypothetical protein